MTLDMPRDRRILVWVKKDFDIYGDEGGWFTAQWDDRFGIGGWRIGLDGFDTCSLIRTDCIAAWRELPDVPF